MPFKVATWNVNSIKQREDACAAWLQQASPDVLCLQELKCRTEVFPKARFEQLGYNCTVLGQKGFNGVAILSKYPISDVLETLPHHEEEEPSRYLETLVSIPDGSSVRVASIYAPNGNPAQSPKYDYKLAWFERLRLHVAQRLALEEPLILAGDFNVIPRPEDVYNASNWSEDALFRLETRKTFQRFMHLGLTDAILSVNAAGGQFTFWDYQAGSWPKNWGLRIDHILLSPEAALGLKRAGIDPAPRAWDKPSDHTPVWASLDL